MAEGSQVQNEGLRIRSQVKVLLLDIYVQLVERRVESSSGEGFGFRNYAQGLGFGV